LDLLRLDLIDRDENRWRAPELTAQRVIVIDPAADRVLLEKNPDLRGQVASTQKLLAALVVLEEGDLDAPVSIASEDSDCPPMHLGLAAGETYSRRELLACMLIGSANDAALALARDSAGSIPAFTARMNALATELGLRDSHFANPHGLPDERQFSSARDVAMLAKAAAGAPPIREMVRAKSYRLRRNGASEIKLRNTNRLLHSLTVCDGMKTGFTRAAGACLVVSAVANGRRRIAVLLNSTKEQIWIDAERTLEWSLAQA
jgi:D-alanyl-D-alanine carboxypeptidase (penicillin-binding protein 5/6)